MDLVLDGSYIETKQLHLKDGARYVGNIVRDLWQHRNRSCLGVVYVLDERLSRLKLEYQPFREANRKPGCDVTKVMDGLNRAFGSVYPRSTEQARVRRFNGTGRLDLYAFVVCLNEPARVKHGD